MVRQERWEELRWLWEQERVPIVELARRFELARKTVRRCLRDTTWRAYQRPAPAATLLTEHTAHLRARTTKVCYSVSGGGKTGLDCREGTPGARRTGVAEASILVYRSYPPKRGLFSRRESEKAHGEATMALLRRNWLP